MLDASSDLKAGCQLPGSRSGWQWSKDRCVECVETDRQQANGCNGGARLTRRSLNQSPTLLGRPAFVRCCRRLLQQGLIVPGGRHSIRRFYERTVRRRWLVGISEMSRWSTGRC